MFKFPYTNLHELNLDWILEKVKHFAELIPPMESAVDDVQEALDDATDAVQKAEQALEDAGDAIDIANEAKDIAEQAAQGTIADGAVTTPKLADGAVTFAKIADGAVTGSKIDIATIQTGNLSEGCVTSNKILDGTVDTSDLHDGAVTSVKIADSNVTLPKLADAVKNMFTPVKLSNIEVATAVSDRVTIDSDECYQIGRLVIVNLRITCTGSVSGGGFIVVGLPAPETSLPAGSAVGGVYSNRQDFYGYIAQQGNIGNTSALSAQTYALSTAYIAST